MVLAYIRDIFYIKGFILQVHIFIVKIQSTIFFCQIYVHIHIFSGFVQKCQNTFFLPCWLLTYIEVRFHGKAFIIVIHQIIYIFHDKKNFLVLYKSVDILFLVVSAIFNGFSIHTVYSFYITDLLV